MPLGDPDPDREKRLEVNKDGRISSEVRRFSVLRLRLELVACPIARQVRDALQPTVLQPTADAGPNLLKHRQFLYRPYCQYRSASSDCFLFLFVLILFNSWSKRTYQIVYYILIN